MSLHIRPAVESEASLIRRMVLGEWLDPTTLKWQNFLVAKQDGEIVGIGQIKQYGGLQELGSLVVKKEQRGKGIAKQLIAALETKADPNRPLYLSCRDGLRGFYGQFGYQEIPLREAPPALRYKVTIPNLFGIKVIVMMKGRN